MCVPYVTVIVFARSYGLCLWRKGFLCHAIPFENTICSACLTFLCAFAAKRATFTNRPFFHFVRSYDFHSFTSIFALTKEYTLWFMVKPIASIVPTIENCGVRVELRYVTSNAVTINHYCDLIGCAMWRLACFKLFLITHIKIVGKNNLFTDKNILNICSRSFVTIISFNSFDRANSIPNLFKIAS